MPVPLRYPVLMPDTPPDIVSELGKSRAMRRLKRELVTGARFQQEFMILRQQRINEANSIIESRVIEGLGARIARIDQEFYFQMMMEHGPDCWADRDFLEDTLRKNPGMAIRVNRPLSVRVDGFSSRGDKHESAGENRALGRTQAHGVPCIEHSPASLSESFSPPRDAQKVETPCNYEQSNGDHPPTDRMVRVAR